MPQKRKCYIQIRWIIASGLHLSNVLLEIIPISELLCRSINSVFIKIFSDS